MCWTCSIFYILHLTKKTSDFSDAQHNGSLWVFVRCKGCGYASKLKGARVPAAYTVELLSQSPCAWSRLSSVLPSNPWRGSGLGSAPADNADAAILFWWLKEVNNMAMAIGMRQFASEIERAPVLFSLLVRVKFRTEQYSNKYSLPSAC